MKSLTIILIGIIGVLIILLWRCSERQKPLYGGCTPYLAGDYYLCKSLDE